MLDRSFIEKIEELSKVEVLEKDGVQYSTKRLHTVNKPMADYLKVNSLDSVVKFINANLDHEKVAYPLIVNVKHDTVNVYSQLTHNLERDHLLIANAEVPSFHFGNFSSVEDFIIKLQTCFVETQNSKVLLKLVSNFVKKDSLEIKDNGISQEVSVKTGVALEEKIDIQPIIKLTPHRTFGEVDQVETMFLFRANKSTNVALFEADGGRWKDQARENVSEYLNNKLSELVESRKVVIIG